MARATPAPRLNSTSAPDVGRRVAESATVPASIPRCATTGVVAQTRSAHALGRMRRTDYFLSESRSVPVVPNSAPGSVIVIVVPLSVPTYDTPATSDDVEVTVDPVSV